MKNIKLAEDIIQKLVSMGVRTFCVSPGGRCAPFIEVLSRAKGIDIYYFYDERSCGFFALGRARRDQAPIAVITTSGTAVAELLPSVIEGYYSGIPLVLITADRPPSYRKQATPQTIKDPIALFKDYSCCSLDLYTPKHVDISSWIPKQGHLHLNVCLNEPLLDSDVQNLDFSKTSTKKGGSIYSDLSKKDHRGFESFFKKCKKPLIFVGELKEKEKPLVENFLKTSQQPFYLEALSQLHHIQERLLSGEKILNYAVKKKEIDGVIRLGGIPRSRFWRDLETTDIEVLNLSSPPFYTGLSRETFHFSLWDHLDLLKKHLLNLNNHSKNLINYDREQSEKWIKILEKYPMSEEAWIRRLKKSFPKNSHVFLGNSLPIRLWDQASLVCKHHLSVTGQNGVNGIDGLISRFFGECKKSHPNFGIIGDISALYDLSAFWIGKNIPPWTLFIMNNSGGQIFSRLFKNKAFLNEHHLSFSSLAQFWNFDYKCFKDFEGFRVDQNETSSLLEICPDQKSTDQVFKDYLSIWSDS